MLSLRPILSVLLCASITVVALAAPPTLLSPARQKLQTMFPAVAISDLEPSALAGFQSAVIGGQVAFVSNDGNTVILGNVYQGENHVDIGTPRLNAYRQKELAKIPTEQRIVYSPANPRFTVTAFVDIDCPYCRKFHEQIVAYNRAGIAIQYVLLPLDMHPNAHTKAESVWCAKDHVAAFTAAMAGGDTGKDTCANPIDSLKKIAMDVGVNGTPALFAEDGRQVGGYATPEQLVQALQVQSGPSLK